jgi:hypothetical protein
VAPPPAAGVELSTVHETLRITVRDTPVDLRRAGAAGRLDVLTI